MKLLLSIICLFVFAGWSQAFHRLRAHGCTGTQVSACQGKTLACTGTQTTACKGAVTASCTGFGIISVPRKTVTRVTHGCTGEAVQTTRSRGTRYVVVPVQTAQPAASPAEKLPDPKKK